MEMKTQIHAEENRQELTITRIFELPVELLFKAYEDAEIVAQWMNTKVLILDCRNYGSYRFETTDPKGNKHYFSGAIHAFKQNESIIRTFEMEQTPFDVSLEFLAFEALTEETSKLTMHVIYKSVYMRNEILKLPFAQGINWAHNRIQDIMTKLQ
ncbi:SRPBCC domain-containing protein [Panacibacter sp. DH6]|uniref:SRPBCC domain-containing protein n=1 Tax=Panacibacter microcysteis TaxID=2793269 RepID=A0A931E9J4_9BACT|nr:SRPBCC domain-containing protein [Panacibacter microcysteis]MBG9377810.1 SRPBCC domain-containing protein [Panacibacter microcysteis]